MRRVLAERSAAADRGVRRPSGARTAIRPGRDADFDRAGRIAAVRVPAGRHTVTLASCYPSSRYHVPVRSSLVPLIGVSPKGRLVYAIMGGNGETDPPATPPAKTFTQAELEAAAARALSDGQRQGKAEQANAIKDALGCTLDEAKALLQKAKDAETEKLSDAEKREQAAIAREQAADAREKLAQARERAALIRAELVTAGAGGSEQDAAKRAEIIADAAKLVDVPDDADEAAIREAVGKVKTRHAAMFGTTTGLPNNPPGGGPPAPASGPKSLADNPGAQRARQMYPVKQTA